MAIKERKQITGTAAQIKGFAGHNGVLAYATDTKHLHVLSGTAGTTTELANRTDIPDITGKADTTYVNAELAKKQAKGDYATNTALTQGLAGKANASHTHTSADVTDLNVTISNALKPYATTNTVNTELAKKANKSHTHAVSDVDGLQVALDGKLDATAKAESAKVADSANSVSWGNVTGKPSIPSSPNAYITETFHSGALWYRKWSDGFIEQGGRMAEASSGAVTLPKAYTSKDYIIVLSPERVLYWNKPHVLIATNVGSTAFLIKFQSDGRVTGSCSWYTAGY